LNKLIAEQDKESKINFLPNVLRYAKDFAYFFLNNQPDALIIPILFCYKTLHVSGIFFAHHQEYSTVQSALVNFMQVSDDRFHGSGHQKLDN
jgi:phosphopantetheine adenylyltransferase